jgi:hypothetical protein
MPSSYTNNLGIELPADGELDGVWGDVVNDNMDILDRAINGTVTLTLSGTSSTLTTSDGTLSDGQYKLLVLAGSPSGTHTITIAPNDAQKIYFVRNTTAQSVVFTQGSGSNVTIATGDSGVLYADGAGAGAAVANLTDHFAMSSVKITGGSIDGAAIGGSSAAAGSFTTGSFSDDLTIADKIVHSGDTNTAIRFPAADTVTVETAGTERLRVDSSGNVGIGTTSPSTKLEVLGGFNSNYLRLSGDDASGARALDFTSFSVNGIPGAGHQLNAKSVNGVLAFATVSSERMRIDTAGNVGIGTSSPSEKLSVVGKAFISLNNSTDHLTIRNGEAGSSASPQFADILFEGFNGNDKARIRGINRDGSAADGALSFETATNATTLVERMRIDFAGNVGIGTSSPARTFHVSGSSTLAQFQSSTSGVYLELKNSGGNAAYIGSLSGSNLVVETGGSERMRIDSSGNLLVGKTATTYTTDGISLNPTGVIGVSKTSNVTLELNRNGTDGTLVSFFKSGTTVGSIGTNGSEGTDIFYGGTSTSLRFRGDVILPATQTGAFSDNLKDLGNLAVRFDDIFATNGTIQTSDRNEKQDIEELSEAEQRVAVACKGLLRKFRWKDAVAEKGDDARIHFGIIAQDLQDAFAAEGLDAGRYAMFIHSTWIDEETGEERSRMGVRYSELLAFMIAAI